MVTDRQYGRLMKLIQQEPSLATAAAKAGMDEQTARKYRELGKLPSQTKPERTWKTRKDAVASVWPEILKILERDESVEAKTIFEYLDRQEPGRFQEGEVRTLQRRITVCGANQPSQRHARNGDPAGAHPQDLVSRNRVRQSQFNSGDFKGRSLWCRFPLRDCR
jgi:hypothetical protein